MSTGRQTSLARSAYIHVPFCAHRCGYCDFTLVARRDDLIERYLSALELDLRTLNFPPQLDTLFLGGGTPTHLPVPALKTLLQLLRSHFRLNPHAEFSVEANPHGLTTEKIALLAEYGVNRISLGVQSFDEQVLKFLERDHQQPEIEQAVAACRQCTENVSLDLIFGVPGQSLESWRNTLQSATELAPRHISAYGLTIEKGTSFWSRRQRGEIVPLADEIERSMYALGMDHLAAAGYVQYELSNYAQPGFECRHNQVYWRGDPFYGFGPGAARYLDGRRELNHRSVGTWIRRIEQGESPIAEGEQLSPEDAAREKIILGLRTTAGIRRQDFHTRTRFSFDDLAADPLKKYVGLGLLEDDGQSVRLTREGRFVADSVIVDFL